MLYGAVNHGAARTFHFRTPLLKCWLRHLDYILATVWEELSRVPNIPAMYLAMFCPSKGVGWGGGGVVRLTAVQ